jgi:hypothetical protein
MTTLQRLLLLLPTLGLASVLGLGCPTGGDDDDVAIDDDDSTVADDDDSTVADDDDSAPLVLTVSGSVTAVDRESGEVLSDEEFVERGSSMIVYLTDDPADLSDPLDKFEYVTATGSWTTTLLGDGTQLYAVAVVDTNRNRVVEARDLLREHGGNPRLLLDADLLDVDITVDLAPRPTGGGGGCCDGPCTNIDGESILLTGATGEIAVTAYSPDLGAGPYEETYQSGPGAFDICVSDDRSYTSLLGIHDSDSNGYFEPSDDIGAAQINPIALGIGDVIGAVIEIPSATPITLPSPPPYVVLQGDAVFPAYTTGNVIVFTRIENTTYSSTTLPAPGPFALRAPPNAEDMTVVAVLDENGDGAYDAVTSPQGSTTVSTLTFDVQGLLISMIDPLDNSISGIVGYAGPVAAGDTLQIALLGTVGGSAPLATVSIPNPVFPQAYTVPDLLAGTYYVTGHLDIGSGGGSAGPGEPVGLYGGSPPSPVVLSGSSHPAAVDFLLQ